MNIILIGVQGSGKGTQAKLLQDKFGWDHITTGELFRYNISQGTKLGKQVKSFIDKGELVPDSYVLGIVGDALASRQKGFILDGFPRNLQQLNFLKQNFKIDWVVLLDLPDVKAIERLLARRECSACKKDYNLLFKKPRREGICDVCGKEIIQRDDDNKIAISKRIEKFHHETEKVIEHYAELGKLIKVDADQSVAAIHQEIISRLGVE